MSSVDYKLLTNRAMKWVVKEAISTISKDVVNAHLIISFKTHFKGVMLSDSLKASYPDEMTIVLQHQYKNLSTTNDHFSVDLMFGGLEQKIVIPFSAITRYVDVGNKFSISIESSDENEPHADPSREKTELKNSTTNNTEDSGSKVIFIDRFRNKNTDNKE